jgi:hypothetical protein
MAAEIVIGITSIIAILAGPIVALRLQTRLDKRREAKDRKLKVFKTLMMHRVTPLSPYFVQALNLIDVEFDAANEKPVRDAWKVLLDHFADIGNLTRAGTPLPPNTTEKSATLATTLLLAMGKSLGYEFDEVQIKKGAYYPQGLGDVEQEQNALRRALLDLLEGKRRMPVALFEDRFPEVVKLPEITVDKVVPPKELPPPEYPVKKLPG